MQPSPSYVPGKETDFVMSCKFVQGASLEFPVLTFSYLKALPRLQVLNIGIFYGDIRYQIFLQTEIIFSI